MEKEIEIVHARQKSIHPTHTLCGKERSKIPNGESTLEIPEPHGIADPNWITCPGCQERLKIDWNLT
jgi:hypothetical protein